MLLIDNEFSQCNVTNPNLGDIMIGGRWAVKLLLLFKCLLPGNWSVEAAVLGWVWRKYVLKFGLLVIKVSNFEGRLK